MSEINDKTKKLKTRLNGHEEVISELDDRLSHLEAHTFRQSSGCGCGPQTPPTFNPFAAFGLTPGVNLPPLGTRLSQEDLTTLAKGLAVGLGIKGVGDSIDAFFTAACKPAEEPATDDEDTKDEQN